MDQHEDDREFEFERDLRPIEDRLAAWRPSSGGLDRDRMLYESGRAAARTSTRAALGRFATAALLVVSIGLAFWTVHQRADLDRERATRRTLENRLLALGRPVGPPIARVDDHSTPAPGRAPIGPPAPGSYFALSERIKRLGATDGLALDLPRDDRAERSSAVEPPRPVPLRARDIDRVLGL